MRKRITTNTCSHRLRDVELIIEVLYRSADHNDKMDRSTKLKRLIPREID